MAGDRQQQIHHGLELRAVDVEDSVAEIEQSEGGDRADEPEHRRDRQNHAHVPGFGLVPRAHVVVGDRQDRGVVEQGEHHDHDRGDGKEVEHDDRQRHEQQHAQRLRDAVHRVAVHPHEDFAAFLDRVDDHRQARRHQHDGGRRPRGVGRAGDREAAIGLLQRGRVVDAVAGHADDVVMLLHDIDDVEFVLREHLREAVGVLDLLGGLRRFLLLGIAEFAAVENVGAHAEGLGHFARDRQRVAGHHLDLHAHLGRGRDGLLRVHARRVEQRQHAEQAPFPVVVGPRHAERAKAARGEIVHGLVDRVLDGGGVGREPWMTCGAPLVTLNVLPSCLLLTVASVRLCTGSNGVKCVTS